MQETKSLLEPGYNNCVPVGMKPSIHLNQVENGWILNLPAGQYVFVTLNELVSFMQKCLNENKF